MELIRLIDLKFNSLHLNRFTLVLANQHSEVLALVAQSATVDHEKDHWVVEALVAHHRLKLEARKVDAQITDFSPPYLLATIRSHHVPTSERKQHAATPVTTKCKKERNISKIVPIKRSDSCDSTMD